MPHILLCLDPLTLYRTLYIYINYIDGTGSTVLQEVAEICGVRIDFIFYNKLKALVRYGLYF